MNYSVLLEPVLNFLHCPTPQAWIDEARKPKNLPLLLTDHMICELKAAQTAAWLIRKYAALKSNNSLILAWLQPYEAFIYRECLTDSWLIAHKSLSRGALTATDEPWADEMLNKMMLLIKEELHHFYQVWEIMQQRAIGHQKITAGRYAKGLLAEVTTHEPNTLVDKLICGAYIEARSCERFAALAPWLESDLANFYTSLLRSEARHYQDYLTLAQQISPTDISERIQFFGQVEASLIGRPDAVFRFHSGIPTH